MGKNIATKPYVQQRTPSGEYEGNGTSHSIVCGFRPKRVHIYSDDNRWIIRHFDGHSTKGLGRMSVGGMHALRGLTLTSGGITITDTGFNVGDNQAVNKNGKTYR